VLDTHLSAQRPCSTIKIPHQHGRLKRLARCCRQVIARSSLCKSRDGQYLGPSRRCATLPADRRVPPSPPTTWWERGTQE
jgi:hypothetical protein